MHIIIYTSPSDKDKEMSDIYPGTEINIGMNFRRKIFNFDVYIGCSQLCRQNTLPSTSDPHNNTDMQSPGGSTYTIHRHTAVLTTEKLCGSRLHCCTVHSHAGPEIISLMELKQLYQGPQIHKYKMETCRLLHSRYI